MSCRLVALQEQRGHPPLGLGGGTGGTGGLGGLGMEPGKL